jgi:N6-adenosine-specific RNA methylase IME4
MHDPKYRTILADPPWQMNQTGNRGASRHYPLMSLDRICALPLKRFSAEDAHLWLWVTNADILQQVQVMEAWGFSYRSCLTWIKPRFGLGFYLRNQTEHLLFGVRGHAPVQFRGQGTWFYAPLQDHSHKPEEAYAIIERLSPGPRLELFARRKRPGWDAWGNEIMPDVVIPRD